MPEEEIPTEQTFPEAIYATLPTTKELEEMKAKIKIVVPEVQF